MEFPVFKTKIPGLTQKFDLTDRVEREKYFQVKAGEEIKKIQARGLMSSHLFFTSFLFNYTI